MIRVLVCKPNEPPEAVEIEANVYAIKNIVGGWFEAFKLNGHLILYCIDRPNEAEFNRTVRGLSIFGTFLISKLKDQNEVSLSDEEIVTLTAELCEPTSVDIN